MLKLKTKESRKQGKKKDGIEKASSEDLHMLKRGKRTLWREKKNIKKRDDTGYIIN